jgi:hypothetical protein
MRLRMLDCPFVDSFSSSVPVTALLSVPMHAMISAIAADSPQPVAIEPSHEAGGLCNTEPSQGEHSQHVARVLLRCAAQVVKRMMGAFEKRCEHMYGLSAFSKRQAAEKQKLQSA